MANMQVNETISYATLKNWEKLKTDAAGRLASRANKRKSEKRILPLEYFCNLDNIAFIQNLIDIVEQLNIPIPSVVLSLAVNRLKQHNILNLSHVRRVLEEYEHINIVEEIVNIPLPSDEFDIIGLVYQSFVKEGKKNLTGSYYTPREIVNNMVGAFDFSNGQTLLDPCCGSGAFLLGANAAEPEQLFGVDNDEIAVLIAKVNILIKYKQRVFYPQIYCMDFLQGISVISQNDIFLKRFDYIVTNPPWGAMGKNRNDIIPDITSNETFSHFFVMAYRQLKTNGIIRFLFPESILNVKVHRDIRSFILARTAIMAITTYDGVFAGVTTKYVDIECANRERNSSFTYYDNLGSREISITAIFETENLVFNFMDNNDIDVIKQVKAKGCYTLQGSTWALGIVTGDNKKKLSASKQDGMEKIYTGKEISPYFLKSAKNYILYDRENLQQVAKDAIYRADEKLVYKFISDNLVFAYDATQSLFLNSANILIPSIPNMTIKTVMAFLNSELFRFLYTTMFGEVKILKGNLIELPFPHISAKENDLISSKVDALLGGDISKEAEIQNIIFSLYEFTPQQICYIRRAVNGKTS